MIESLIELLELLWRIYQGIAIIGFIPLLACFIGTAIKNDK